MTPEDIRALIKEMKISFPTQDHLRNELSKLEDKIDAIKKDTTLPVRRSALDEEMIGVYKRLTALEKEAGITVG